MTRIVVGAPLDLPGAWASQGWDQSSVDAQNQRAYGRGQIKPDNVAHLVDRQRIGGELERLGAMRLKRDLVRLKRIVRF